MPKRKRAKLDRFFDTPPKDRISDLPDSILIHHILNQLPFEQVVETSILSRRWRHLHLQTSVMQFLPKPHMFDEAESSATGIGQEPPSESAVHRRQYFVALSVMIRYARRVNLAIAANYSNDTDGCSLVRFCIHFPCLIFDHMESWLKFALKDKGVEELELRSFIDPYRVEVTKRPSAQIQLSLFPKLWMLKSLTLCQVPMNSNNLEHLLLTCVSLERLHLKRLLSNEDRIEIRVTGPMSRLKFVCVDDFDFSSMSIVVSAPTPDLVSLRYSCFVQISPIKFAPRLIDLSIICGSYYYNEFDLPSHQLFNYVSQLQSLHLDTAHWQMVKHWLPRQPDLSGLKRLTLTISPSKGTAVGVFRLMIFFINAAHCLQHLTLNVREHKFFWIAEENESEEWADMNLPSLRVIEFDRFEGTLKQRQLVE